ncbi:MAG: 2-isopropylmalate synthase [Myxococcaceae bacterium]|nr:2-isopropylmalate synthase [Myxococcaceae bacterium]
MTAQRTPDSLRIFDTTLRDGEQSPGATMTMDEKLRIAKKLEQLGVDVIEAGFPAASPGEIESVRRIGEEVRGCEIAGLCRTREGDIQAAWKALQHAAKPRLHTFIATSKLHMEHKLRLSEREVLEEIRRGVAACRSLTANVEFSAEDSTRSDLGFLKEACSVAIEAGASVLNLPDTVGYTTPDEYKTIVEAILAVIGTRDVIISTHCHNDLGLAVANSLAAISAGARQVECCINGIGERAGNAALEEIVMALKVRPQMFPVQTRIVTEHLYPTSRLVSEITGLNVQPNKAIVGRNAFAHEAGIHQHGMLADRRTYEIMEPQQIGLPTNSIVLGKHSGRAALKDRLQSLGYELTDVQLSRAFESFKQLCDKKKTIYDDDLYPLVAEDFSLKEVYRLVDVEFRGGSEVEPWARVFLEVDGVERTAEAGGDGPVEAVIEAIKAITEKPALVLKDYDLEAVSGGADAQGKVSLSIEEAGLRSRGQGRHTDVVVASALAFVNALNQQMYQRKLNQLRSDPPITVH